LLPEITMTPFEQRITDMIEPSLTGMGYELVRVQLNGQTRKTLQIMAERLDNRGMTLNDCEQISETLSAVLDVHDPIKEKYALEISSGGIDRPLAKAKDFAKYIGHEVKAELKEAVDGRRHFKGLIHASDDKTVTVTGDKDELFTLDLDNLHKAKLLLTDELIDAHLAEQAKYEEIDQTPVEIETDDADETEKTIATELTQDLK
jgi:ribosome maturation factor RimP